jgi:hypothetical protein
MTTFEKYGLWHTMTEVVLQRIIDTDPDVKNKERATKELELRETLRAEAEAKPFGWGAGPDDPIAEAVRY